MKNFKQTLLTISILSLSMVGCIQEKGSSPISKTGANVTVQSSAYTNDGTVAFMKNPIIQFMQNSFLIPSAMAAPVADLQACITKLKVVSQVDGAPSASQEAILGLVDLSDSTVDTIWGNITLAEGAQISEIHFEVHYDPENCAAEVFSASYNGQTITQDLEFKFKFDPAISIQNGDTLDLGIGVIAKAFEDASAAAQFNNAQITNYLQTTTIGTGSKL